MKYLNEDQKNALEEIKDRVRKEFAVEYFKLFGSAVRGEMDEESDIDLLIVTVRELDREEKHKIIEIVFKVNLKYETNFSTLIVYEEIWNGKYSVMPIYQEIEKEGVKVG